MLGRYDRTDWWLPLGGLSNPVAHSVFDVYLPAGVPIMWEKTEFDSLSGLSRSLLSDCRSARAFVTLPASVTLSCRRSQVKASTFLVLLHE